MTVGIEHYLVVSAILFALGLLGVIVRRNLLVIVIVAERVPQAELASRRHPLHRVRLRIEPVIELCGAHA